MNEHSIFLSPYSCNRFIVLSSKFVIHFAVHSIFGEVSIFIVSIPTKLLLNDVFISKIYSFEWVNDIERYLRTRIFDLEAIIHSYRWSMNHPLTSFSYGWNDENTAFIGTWTVFRVFVVTQFVIKIVSKQSTLPLIHEYPRIVKLNEHSERDLTSYSVIWQNETSKQLECCWVSKNES